MQLRGAVRPLRRRRSRRHPAPLAQRLPLLHAGGGGGRQPPPRPPPPPIRPLRLLHLRLPLRVPGHQDPHLHRLRAPQAPRHRNGGALRPPALLRRRRPPGDVARLQRLRRPALRRHRQPHRDGGALRAGLSRGRRRAGDGAGGHQVRPRHRLRQEPRRAHRRPQKEGGRERVRSGLAGRRHWRPRDRLRFHVHLQGSLHGAAWQTDAGSKEPATEPGDPPRRSVRPEAGADGGAGHLPVDPLRLPPLPPPRLHQPSSAGAHRVPQLPPHGHQTSGEGHAAAAPQEGSPGRALCLQPPHGAGPGGHRRRPAPKDQLRHLQHQQVLGVDLAHQGRRADAGARQGRRLHQAAAGGGRPGDLPRGHHLPRALPAALQRSLRRAHRPHRPRGHQHQTEHVPRHQRQGVEDIRSVLLLHEPEAGLRYHVLEPTPEGAHLRRRQAAHRSRQLHTAGARRHARLRVHRLHQEGQVRSARRHRRPGLLQEGKQRGGEAKARRGLIIITLPCRALQSTQKESV